MKTTRARRARRGSSFIEILVSLALLAVVMVGILQMFSLSLLTNLGSAARTDLLYKAQQVVENLRLIYYLSRSVDAGGEGNDTARAAAGVPAFLATTASPIYLPYLKSDTPLKWNYWGPQGLNIIEDERLPYRLSYTVEERQEYAIKSWLVTVTATPVDNPNLNGTLPPVEANARLFLGLGSKLKIVTYSAQLGQ